MNDAEQGAHFRGDSFLTAHFTTVDMDAVKMSLAFSTTAVRNTAQALLLVQTSNESVAASPSPFPFDSNACLVFPAKPSTCW